MGIGNEQTKKFWEDVVKEVQAMSSSESVSVIAEELQKFNTMVIEDFVKDYYESKIEKLNNIYECLSKENQELEEQQNKWISIADMLPNDGDIVLGYGIGKIPVMCTYRTSPDKAFERYVDFIPGDRVQIVHYDKITNWQPLPQLPTI